MNFTKKRKHSEFRDVSFSKEYEAYARKAMMAEAQQKRIYHLQSRIKEVEGENLTLKQQRNELEIKNAMLEGLILAFSGNDCDE